MTLQAQVKQNSRVKVVTAFGGREYVPYEWRQVPAGVEEEADRHPMLSVREIGAVEEQPVTDAESDAGEESPEVSEEVIEMLKGTVGQVSAALQQIDDLELLQRIHDLDERVTVKRAAKARMNDLREEAESDAGEEGEDEGGE